MGGLEELCELLEEGLREGAAVEDEVAEEDGEVLWGFDEGIDGCLGEGVVVVVEEEGEEAVGERAAHCLLLGFCVFVLVCGCWGLVGL
jgi:hypothetical protein